MQISQGQRIPLSNLIQGRTLSVAIQIKSSPTVDLACFALDAFGKLSDARNLIFYNQRISPCGSLRQVGAQFSLKLSELPSSIERLVFTASIDGEGAMGNIRPSTFVIKDRKGEVVATCPFAGNIFGAEKSIMVADLYREDGHWHLASNLQGFNEDLTALVRHYGGRC
ncbi:TerD family protein [Pseudomonas aeruginosa]|uniref:TerD family protein n=1 Tax=Pseudomonas guariconensis TaxID=1288410 RepID=UPI003672F19E